MSESRRYVKKMIVALTDSLGYPPTLRELSQATQLSVGSVRHHLLKLEETGEITRGKEHRSIVVRGEEA